jgi:hypothetical protein
LRPSPYQESNFGHHSYLGGAFAPRGPFRSRFFWPAVFDAANA